jgi:hypothetical protein
LSQGQTVEWRWGHTKKEGKMAVTRKDFIENQKKYCKENGAPFFMPEDGFCYSCRRDIIPALIGKDKDGTKLITGCPLCFRSYCD